MNVNININSNGPYICDSALIWGGPGAPKHTKSPPARRPGCQLIYLNTSPTERRWQHMGSAVQPRLSELN